MRRHRDKPTQTGDASWPDSWLLPPPLPEVSEGGDSTWEAWQEAARQLEVGFAPTEPSDLAPLAAGTGAREADAGHAHDPLSAAALMVLARRHNRVCPRPASWLELYRLLGGDRNVGLQPPPVERWMWTKLSDLQKRLLFRDYVDWAERHGRLRDVARFMEGLAETDWLHMGER